jgi:putative glutamine amidotransferase
VSATRSAPLIGICAAVERARWSVWDLPAALVPMNYIEQVQRAGGVALLIPPDPALVADPGLILERIDGLMLVGGPDVEASRYAAAPHPAAEPPAPLRDAVEIALMRGASERGLPVLGICRGMQVINVARGGTLRQHLPEDLGGDEHRRIAGSLAGNEHAVRLAEGSRAQGAAGADPRSVTSHHHQAVDGVGAGLRVTGWHEADGVAEALEGDDAAWLVGVQWHPEADPGSPVIAALVRAADERRREGVDRREGGDSSIPAARPCERS